MNWKKVIWRWPLVAGLVAGLLCLIRYLIFGPMPEINEYFGIRLPFGVPRWTDAPGISIWTFIILSLANLFERIEVGYYSDLSESTSATKRILASGLAVAYTFFLIYLLIYLIFGWAVIGSGVLFYGFLLGPLFCFFSTAAVGLVCGLLGMFFRSLGELAIWLSSKKPVIAFGKWIKAR
ncbi:MAG: hypothetical protein CEN90_270 [Parcubacteria group bacterium Licking1014_17]|nr:MAG: hypothetical protein CEN90_270 [Parcubacteria group bacterium Licking1014_17]